MISVVMPLAKTSRKRNKDLMHGRFLLFGFQLKSYANNFPN